MHFPTLLALAGASLTLAMPGSSKAPKVSAQSTAHAKEISDSAFIATTSSGEPESFQNATALGVDIFGGIPDDHVKKNDHIIAEPGSQTFAWIRAQIDIDWDNLPEGVEKRDDYANMGVGLWTSDACTGTVAYRSNVQYNWNYWDYANNMYSVGTTGRRFVGGERLNLWRRSGTNQCAVLKNYVDQNTGSGGPGCYYGGPFNCFGMRFV